MTIAEILLSKHVLGAIFIFTVISIVVEMNGNRLLARVSDVTPTHWIFERTLVPFARAGALMIFMLIAYPLLFGIAQAPPIVDLLLAGPNRISTLINILFIIPLFFPVIPVAGQIPALLLPIQGIAGSTLIFTWMQAALDVDDIQYLPSLSVFVIIIIYAIVAHYLAVKLAEPISEKINTQINTADAEKIVYRILIVVAQLPTILFYTIGLGNQVS